MLSYSCNPKHNKFESVYNEKVFVLLNVHEVGLVRINKHRRALNAAAFEEMVYNDSRRLHDYHVDVYKHLAKRLFEAGPIFNEDETACLFSENGDSIGIGDVTRRKPHVDVALLREANRAFRYERLLSHRIFVERQIFITLADFGDAKEAYISGNSEGMVEVNGRFYMVTVRKSSWEQYDWEVIWPENIRWKKVIDSSGIIKK